MTIKYELKLPYHYGEVVSERLKVLELDEKYKAYTLNEKLEIEELYCSIENNGNWNYHNNYDSSENVLKVGDINKWWTLNKTEIEQIQREHIDRAINFLTQEINKLKEQNDKN